MESGNLTDEVGYPLLVYSLYGRQIGKVISEDAELRTEGYDGGFSVKLAARSEKDPSGSVERRASYLFEPEAPARVHM